MSHIFKAAAYHSPRKVVAALTLSLIMILLSGMVLAVTTEVRADPLPDADDTVPPTLTVLGSLNGSVIPQDSAELSWSFTDDGSGPAYSLVRLDEGGWENATTCTVWTFDGLAEGPHTVDLMVFDNAGNNATIIVTFTVDTIPPTLSITFPAEGGWVNTSDVNVTWQGDGGSGIAGYQYRLDGGDWSDPISDLSHIFEGLAQGDHVVEVRAIDLAGNNATDTVAFQVDSVAPALTVTSPSDDLITSVPSVTFIWSGSDGGSGLAGYQYDLDGNGWSDLSPGVQVTLGGLSDGAHTWTVRAVDVAGNNATVIINFIVDTTPPTITYISPEEGSFVGSSTVAVNCTAEDPSSGVQDYRFRLDGGAWSSWGPSAATQYNGLAIGMHIIEVEVRDNAGNLASLSATFIVDTVPPTVAITSPSSGHHSGSSTVPVSWTADDANGIAGYEYQLNGGGWTWTASLSHIFEDLPDGTCTVSVRAVDVAGNNATASVTFTVDTVAPTLDSVSLTGSGISSTNTVTVQWAGSDIGSGVAGYQYRIDGGAWSSLTSATAHTFVGLADGQHVVSVRVVDRAGNIDTGTVIFIVDTTPPTIIIDHPAEGAFLSTRSVPLSWTGSDSGSGIRGYQYRIGTGEWSPLTDDLGCTLTFTADGTYTVEVRVVDNATLTAVARVTFVVDITESALGIDFPASGAVLDSSSVQVLWFALDDTAGLNNYQYRLDNGTWSAPAMVFGHLFDGLDDGPHTVEVRAEDRSGNVIIESVTFIVDTTSPVLTIDLPSDGAVFGPGSVTASWTADDANGITYQYQLDGGAWSSLSSSTSATFGGLADGEHVLLVRAEDSAGNAAVAAATFIVDTVPPEVKITSLGVTGAAGHRTVTVGWTAEDLVSGIDYIQVSIDGVNWVNLTSDASSYAFTDLPDGTYTVSVRAVDRAGNAAVDSYTVITNWTGPTFDVTAPDDHGISFNVDEVTVTWALGGTFALDHYEVSLDGGVFFSVGLATTYTFTDLDDGTHTVVVHAVAADSSYLSDSVTFTVDTVAPELSILSPANNTALDLPAIVVACQCYDATSGLYGLQYRLDNGAWSALTLSAVRSFSGLGNGAHTVEIMAVDNAGNENTTSVTFIVDTTWPSLTIDSPSDGAYFGSPSVTVYWNGTDTYSGIAGYQYRLDGGAWSSLTSGTEQLFEGLSVGVHYVEVRAYDRAGHYVRSGVSFVVDMVDPTVEITSPSDGHYSGSSAVQVNWTGYDSISGLAGYRYSFDGEHWSELMTGATFNFTGLPDGTCILIVRAFDNVGNFADASITFVVDTTAPSVVIGSPGDGVLGNSPSVQVQWSGDDDTSGVQGYRYRLDGGHWSTLTNDHSFTFTGLGNGAHTVEIMAVDNAGNENTTSVIFSIDTTPPALTIAPPPNGALYNYSTVTANWTATDTSGVAGYQYNLDGLGWTSTTDLGALLEGLSEGSHTLRVRAIDNVDNVAEASVTFTVDTVDPSITVTAPPGSAIYRSTSVTVIWTGSDATSGLQGYRYRLDGGAWSSLGSSVSKVFSGLAQGNHTVEVMAVDRAGNNATASVTFMVDTVAPDLEVGSPDNGDYTSSTAVTVVWSATDATSGVQGYRYRLDGGAWSSIVAGLEHEFTGLSNGPHKVDVRAIDNAGNSIQVSVTFIVDTVPPVVTIQTPSDGSYSTSSTVTVSWTGSDSLSGIAGYWYSLDGGDTWLAPTSGLSTVLSGLAEGSRTVLVKAVDNVGNEAIDTVTFIVDTVRPGIIISNPVSSTLFGTSSVTVYWNGSDATSGVKGYQYSLNGVTWTSTSDLSHTFSGLGDGAHTVHVKAIDNAGNENTTTVSFTTDITAPLLSITPPGQYYNVSYVTVNWSATDATSGVQDYQYRLGGTGAWSDISMGLGYNFTGLSDGLYTVYVRAIDHAGNVKESSVTFRVDTTPPSISITSPGEGAWTNSKTVYWTGSDTGGSGIAYYQYRVDGGAWSSPTTSPSHAFSALTDGDHTVEVRAYDNAGNYANDTVSFRLDVTLPTVTITVPSPNSVFNVSSVLVRWTGGDDLAGVMGYQYSIDGGATWSALSMSTEHTFGPLADGHYVVQVRVTDNAGNSKIASVAFTVDTTPPELTFDYPPNGADLNSTTVEVTWSAHDNTTGVQGYRYRIDSGAWSSYSMGTSATFGPLSQGYHTVYVEAIDIAGNNITKSVTFNVDTVDPEVTISNPPEGFETNSSSVQVWWNGTDDNSGLQGYKYRIDNGEWSDLTSDLTHVFTNLKTGTHRVDVMMLDNASNSVMDSVNFTVDLLPPSLTIDGPANSSYTNDPTVEVSWTGDDNVTGLQGYQWKLDGGDWSEMSMDDSHTFSDLPDGTYTVWVRALDKVNNVNMTSVTFTVDTVDPEVEISSPEGGLTNSKTVYWNGTDDRSGVDYYQYRVDGGEWTNTTDLSHLFEELGDGHHTVDVRVYDRAGNFADDVVSFILDTTLPAVLITTPQEGSVFNEDLVTVQWNGMDSLAGIDGYQWKLDGGNWSFMSSDTSRIFSGLSEGHHTVYVKAVDKAGNENTTSVTFLVDTVDPTVEITSPEEDDITNDTSVTVYWNGGDTGSGIRGYQYKLDNRAWSDLTSNLSQTFTGLSDGEHTVLIRAIDNAGNKHEVSVTFIVDTTPPAVWTTPPGPYRNVTSFIADWTASDANGISGYQYSLDGVVWIDTTGTSRLFNLPDGQHTIYVKAFDKAGNSATVSITFIVDTADPWLTVDAPPNGSYLRYPWAMISWTGYDVLSGVQGYRYNLDGNGWSSLTSDLSHLFDGLVDGEHTVEIMVFDRANNSGYASVTFTVDTVLPSLEITAPDPGSYHNNSTVTVNWTGGDGLSGIKGYQYKLDGGAWYPTALSYQTFTGLSDGEHTVLIRAIDNAGNEHEVSVTFYVDTVAPNVHIDAPGPYVNSTNVPFSWSAWDLTSAVRGYQYMLDENGWSEIEDLTAFTFTGLSDGEHTVRIRAWDLANNTAEILVTFVVDTVRPDLSVHSSAGGPFTGSADVTVEWWADDATSGTAGYRYRLDHNDWSGPVSDLGCVFRGLGEGTHVIEVMAVDRAGNVDRTSVTFTVDLTAPTLFIDAPADGSVTNRSLVAVLWHAVDGGSGVSGYQYNLDGKGWTSPTGSFGVELEELLDGPHTLEVRVFDQVGNVRTVSISFTVDTTAPSVSIVTPFAHGIFDEDAVSSTWTGSDSVTEVKGYQYRLDDGEWSARTMDQSHVFGRLSEGDHIITVRVFDAANNTAEASVAFVVDTIAPELKIDDPGNGTHFASPMVTVFWTGGDTGSGIKGYQYKLDNGAWSATIDDLGHAFTGLTDGSHTVQVKAVDNAGHEAITSVTFIVDNAAPNVVINSPGQGHITNDTSVTVNWTATDPLSGIKGYQYRLDGGAWTSTLGTECTFAGLTNGLHKVDVRAIDNANNSVIVTVAFIVDTGAPELAIDAPPHGAFVAASSVTVSWTGIDGLSGIAGYKYRLDNRAWSGLTSELSHVFGGLTDGEHTIYVMAIDQAGNENTTSVTFIVDTTLPSVWITSPDPGSYHNLTSPVTVNWGSDDEGLKGFRYSIDGSAWSDLTGDLYYIGTLGDGEHTVRVKAVDRAGNENVTSVTFIVDTAGPSVHIDAPLNGAYANTSGVMVKWSAWDLTSGIKGYQYRLDGGDWSDLNMIYGFEFTGLKDGQHTVQVCAWDLANNTAETYVTFIVDTAKPTVSIHSPGDGSFIGSAGVTVEWSGADITSGVLGYRYRVDGGAWSGLTSDRSRFFGGLGEGEHIVEVMAVDLAGNTNQTSVAFTVDLTAPVLSIDAPEDPTSTNQSLVGVFWSAADGSSGVRGYEYRIDGGAWSDLTSGTEHLFEGLTDGHHIVTVRAFDRAGNVATASVNITVDTTAPSVTITSPTPGQAFDSDAVALRWSGSDATTGVRGYQYRLDDGDWSELTSDLSGAFEDLPEGLHTYYLRAFDNVNNTVEASVSFMVDTVDPVLFVDSPPEGAFVGTSTVTISWTGSDATSGIAGYRYRLDGGAWSSLTSDLSHLFGGLANGEHTITVKAIDNAGNDVTASVTFTVDAAAPWVIITSPGEGYITNGTSVTVIWFAEDGTSEIVGYQYKLDGHAWSSLTSDLSHVFSGLSDGEHVVSVKAIDYAGNEAIASVAFIVDRTAPSVWISSPTMGSYHNGSSVAVYWDGSDATSGLAGFMYRLDGGEWSSTVPDLTGLADGVHTVYVMAVDKAGNEAMSSVTFIVDTTMPGLIVDSPPHGAILGTPSVTVSWTGNDTGSGIRGYQYKLDSGAWSSLTSDLSHLFGGLANGEHTITVKAIDNAGNDVTASVTFTVDAAAPWVIITSPGEGYITNGTSVTVFWEGGDASSGVAGYQYKLDNGAWSATIDDLGHAFTGLTDGSHTVQVKAVDNAGHEAIASITFIVDTTPPSVGVSAPPSGSYLNSSSVAASWSGSDAASGLRGFRYSIDGGAWSPVAMTWSTAFSGLADGLHTIVVEAFDKANNSASASLTFRVDATAPILFIDGPADGHISASSSVTVSWSGADLGSGIAGYQYRLDDGAWSGWNAYVSRTFTGLGDGTHVVQIRVMDHAGNIAAAAVEFTVDTTAPELTIDSPGNDTYWNTPTVHVSWTGSDATTDVQGYRVKVGSGPWSELITGTGADVSFTGYSTVYVEAIDLAGNARIAEVRFIIDTEVPSVVITHPAEGSYSNVSWMNVTWSGSDAISGIAYYQVRLDGGEWSEPLYISYLNLTGLSDAPHSVEVRAVDRAGNENITSVAFVVDVTAPTIDIADPSDDDISSSSAVTVSWSGDDATSGVAGYRYRLDGGAWSSLTAETSMAFTLSDGVHTVEVMVYDRANNSASAAVTFMVDATPPTVSIEFPEDGSTVNTTGLSWTGSDATSGIAGHQYRVDGGEWSENTTDLSAVLLGLSEGPHTIEVRAWDEAGNSATATITIVFDTVPPTVGITSPGDGTGHNESSLTASWSGDDVTSNMIGYQYRLDGGEWSELTALTSYEFSGLSEGTHVITVRAFDAAGNSAYAEVTVLIDTVDPLLNVPGDGSEHGSSEVTVNWTGSDDGSGIQGYRYRVDSGSWSELTTALGADLTGLSDGTHVIEVMAFDNVNNTRSVSIAITVDTTVPELTIGSPEDSSFLNDPWAEVSWSARDQTTAVTGYQYRIDGGEWSALSSEIWYNFTGLGDGPHTVEVRATDRVGNIATASVTFLVDTAAPSLVITSPEAAEEISGTSATVSWTAGADATKVEVRLSGSAWTTVSGENYTFEGLQAGSYTAEVRVTDAAGNTATEQVSFTVIAEEISKEHTPDNSDWLALIVWATIAGTLFLALQFTRKKKGGNGQE